MILIGICSRKMPVNIIFEEGISELLRSDFAHMFDGISASSTYLDVYARFRPEVAIALSRLEISRIVPNMIHLMTINCRTQVNVFVVVLGDKQVFYIVE